jgi:hypothetical protein
VDALRLGLVGLGPRQRRDRVRRRRVLGDRDHPLGVPTKLLGPRRGDGAEIAIVELLCSEYKPEKPEEKGKKGETEKKPEAKAAKPAAKAKEAKEPKAKAKAEKAEGGEKKKGAAKGKGKKKAAGKEA